MFVIRIDIRILSIFIVLFSLTLYIALYIVSPKLRKVIVGWKGVNILKKDIGDNQTKFNQKWRNVLKDISFLKREKLQDARYKIYMNVWVIVLKYDDLDNTISMKE